MANKNTKLIKILARYAVVTILILGLSGWIIFRLVDNTVLHADRWNLKADTILTKTVPILPVRGDILSCDGNVLATNVNSYTLRIDYRTEAFREQAYLDSLPALCDSLAAHFPVRSRAEWEKHLTAQMKLEKKDRSRRWPLLRDISFEDYKLVRTFPFFNISNCNRNGLTRETVINRLYPYGDMARRSIGRTNHPDGHLVGFSGLEYALDSMLKGKPGRARKVPLTRNIVPIPETPAENGHTVITTIDVEMQDIVETELNSMLSWAKADWGTAVLMEVNTGDIKAISNLERRKGDSTYIESMNHAVQRVEPGSVIKLVGMIVALQDGIAGNINRRIATEVGGYHYQNAKPIRDTHFDPSGSLPVYSLLEYSSNIGMTKLVAPAFEHDPDAFRRRVEELGIFDRFNTGIAAEAPALYPRLPNNRGGRIGLSRLIYGYSSQISPLYTCALYNAIANDGHFVRPRLVKGLINSEGVESSIPVSYVRESICSPSNAKTLRQMLRRVITERGGTAKGLKRDEEIVELAGKTGTALIAKERPRYTHEDSVAGRVVPFVPGYLEGHYRLAFVGFFPYEHPLYTCMVVISDPKPGIKSAQFTSGATVRAIAEKMHSRGMLENVSDFSAETNPDAKTAPELYATTRSDRVGTLCKDLNIKNYGHFSKPSPVDAGIPDVKGLGVREALLTLEEAGYEVRFTGSGYVENQTPSPGTRAPKGSKVTLKLSEY